MNKLMSLIIVLAVVVAISSAIKTPKVVEAAAHAPAHSGQATHKYPMELMKKKVLVQLAKIQNSDMTEEAKQIAITHVYDQYRKAAGAYRTKKVSSAADAKSGLDDGTAAKHPDVAAHLMHNLEMHVGGLRQQGQGNHHASGSRMNAKKSHNGASIRRMAKGFADAEGQPGMTRKRRSAPVKKLRQSIARAV